MTLFAMRLDAVRREAEGVCSFELGTVDGAPFPPFAAGAHVDLHLPNGLVRQYSLVGRPGAGSFVIGVKHEPEGRGGSAYLHQHMRVGAAIDVGAPRNNFPLAEDASHVVLVAGGIGVTPLAAMALRLRELRRSFEVHYAVQRRQQAAFLALLAGPELVLHVDEEQGRPLDVAGIVRGAAHDAHLYCCGPGGMLEAFEDAAAARPPAFVHVERFAPARTLRSGDAFTVEFARSAVRLLVAPDQTILSVARGAGIGVPSSCEQGLCGTCETRVLAGRPDHKDSFFTDEEKSGHASSMLICCSRSRDELLVLDL